MRKILIIIFTILGVSIHSFAQDDQQLTIDDIQPKSNNPQSYITASSGKINTSIPIMNIQSRGLFYPISLNYNGTDVFDQAQYLNRYKPTSTIGIGWSLGTPKIVVDNKNTGTREDDTFYLNGSKLICTNKNISTTAFGYTFWEFESQNYQPWLIRYYISRNDVVFDQFNNEVIINTSLDHWEITNELGVKYSYGKTIDDFGTINNKSKEKIIVWGNWIGDSNQSGGQNQTLIWNLSSIEDQWLNRIDFEYELQESSLSGNSSLKQTEASYISKISSSTGQNIKFNYAQKKDYEFYEPHIEQIEPDAYQERYEKMYLDDIELYNDKNNLINTYNLEYDISSETSQENRKRYLVELIKKDKNNLLLPSHEFDYYLSGDFKGGIKNITYPLGGNTTYTYNKKFLFSNAPQQTSTSNGYKKYAEFTGENYYLSLEGEDISNDNRVTKLVRHSYTGDNIFNRNEFTFPNLLNYDYENSTLKDIEKVKFIFGYNFYGAITYDNDNAKLYLFHLNKDGVTWDEFVDNSIDVDTYNADSKHNPAFISGDDFVAIGSYENGKLHTYVWNGSGWNQKTISQGTNGDTHYHYQATNNYIITLNNGSGIDYIDGNFYNDLFYIHYLDATKNFLSKSLSSQIDPYLDNIPGYGNSESYFYPSNGMTSLVSVYNPESIIRWDKDYNIIAVDDIFGNQDNNSPITSINNSLFTLHDPNSIFYPAIKTTRFNGVNWVSKDILSDKRDKANSFGNDKLLAGKDANSDEHYFLSYNPNTNNWTDSFLNSSTDYNRTSIYGFTNNFFAANQHLYSLTNNGNNYLGEINSETSRINHVFSNSTGNLFIEYYWDQSGGFLDEFISLNKKNNSLQKNGIIGSLGMGDSFNRFGGRYSILSNSLFCYSGLNGGLFKVIDNQINQDVFDIVVSSIIKDNNDTNTENITIQYDYNNPKLLLDSKSTVYGEVSITEQVFVWPTNYQKGKIIKYFNTGDTDIQMAGLPIKEVIEDKQGNIKQQKESSWQKFNKDYSNSEGVIGSGQYIRIINQNELVNLDNSTVESETINLYNDYGLLYDTSVKNSKGEWNNASSTFAYEQYSFLEDKNMLSMPFEKVTKKNGTTTSVEQIKWIQDNGNVYPYENWSGISNSGLRLNNKTNTVTDEGIVVETEDGLGKSKSVLLAYNNLYEVATITNAKYVDVINALDVTYAQLQNLSTANLKIELLKLYDRLPNALVSLNLYNEDGNIITEIDNRKEELNYFYDTQNRVEYISDSDDFVIKKYKYHYKGQEEEVPVQTYTVTNVIDGGVGSVSITSTIVESGSYSDVTATPGNGYEIDYIKVGATSYPFTNNTARINNITSDTEVHVKFKTLTTAFSVSPTDLFFEDIDGNKTITVTSSGSWSVSKSDSWIIISTTTGSGNGTFTIRPLKNLGSLRTGTVTVSDGSTSITLSIEQLGGGGPL